MPRHMGIITAVVAIIDGVLYLVYTHNNYHMVPAAILGKLYVNSLLVLLNSRRPQLSDNVRNDNKLLATHLDKAR
ncbi:hypothetical protein PENSPDRAFT_687085 [Peniophora sp. CONT]|nr:hypothetical protein PENSPDRAFT_687085 [Peniophora sp. CONT]